MSINDSKLDSKTNFRQQISTQLDRKGYMRRNHIVCNVVYRKCDLTWKVLCALDI